MRDPPNLEGPCLQQSLAAVLKLEAPNQPPHLSSYPHLPEGTPNVIIEAMAHEKPIIATAVGGVPDLVTEEVGILVPPDDSRALAAAMTRMTEV